ncbi:methylenetetrahydrofolate reductase (NADPH) [Neorhizobium sp. R1-B]|uniref:methylenetetrahydrofolate reductase n=1 Tax=unclassified Neorhizobium TaxID=2629175 RepID=UPI0010529457|nr:MULTISPECIES: methylenetetrahydrofolate reductase [unclassified Neorhizobium]TCV70071.1 methylenetetrahydrofolate reductase (NADPH) [Neorhizobium sp. S3-V5DH]TDX80413.1 methylenetetrahydrofolate reductase (NADPH) [Neorhizobium sp. R1-B]
MALLNLFKGKQEEKSTEPAGFRDLITDYSIEVMPRTAAKIEDFKVLLPKGTRVYIAHIDGTPIEDMVLTAKRLAKDGFAVMPHFPSRIIPSVATLEDWIKRYRNEAGVDQALLLGGGVTTPAGDFDSSIQLIESGLFDRYGFKRLHVAGHPEGNKDIDTGGGTKIVDEALQFKQAFSQRTDAEMAIVTQFAFDAKPVIAWAERIAAAGIKLPIHLGVAGPTKLQTLIKFAVSCGVGASLSVLQRRAMDLSKLLVPYEPTDFLTEIAEYKAAHPESLIDRIHVFPLGGIRAGAEWMNEQISGERAITP